MSALAVWDAARVLRLGPLAAVDALEAALVAGLDPEADPPRAVIDAPSGQLLLMPSVGGAHAGVKLATVGPGNPRRGLPRIQGLYILLDAATLTPVALLDGAALTTLRTPAVSALAVRHLASPGARRLVVFGTGPQAEGHVTALRMVRPLEEVVVVGRDEERVRALVARCADGGLTAWAGGPDAVAEADVVACCTTARSPLFDGRALPAHATIVAMGSHEPDAREVDDETVRRSTVVAESRAAALREAGDLVQAVRAGVLRPEQVGNLAELVAGSLRPEPDRPRLFASVGMAWEDLVVAAATHARDDESGP